jgi:hypothetical protein
LKFNLAARDARDLHEVVDRHDKNPKELHGRVQT